MGYKVTLDPGHGGSDPGACYGNLIEKVISLTVALKCQKELQRHGVEVHMTRTSDTFVDLLPRAHAANAAKSSYFVSIHCNAGGGNRGEVIHSIHRGKGLELSNKISEEMKAIGQSFVKVYEKAGDGNKDYYSVIRNTDMDAVIVECAFLDNEVDNKKIDTVPKQETFGVAIAKGILRQLGIAYKAEGGTTQPIPPPAAPIPSVTYQLYTGGRWLPNVVNTTDYAGIYGQNAQAMYASLSRGSIRYRVRTVTGRWLPWVTDRTDYAGIYGTNIDAIECELVGLPEFRIKYQVYTGGKWLSYVYDRTDYAGIYGQPIQGLRMELVRR